MSTSKTATLPSRNTRRRGRRVVVVIVVLIAAAVATPWLLQSVVRDAVLTAALNDPQLTISSGAASFPWSGTTTVTDLKIHSNDGRLQLDIARLEFDRPWWKLLLNESSLGTVEVDQPTCVVELTQEESDDVVESLLDPGGPLLSATIRQGSLQCTIANDPTISIADVDLQLEIIRDADVRQLTLAPQVLIRERAATPELCHDLLQWLDPSLAEIVEVDGKVTLSIDSCRIPLDVSDQERLQKMQLSGSIELLNFRAVSSTPLLTGLLEVMSERRTSSAEEAVQLVRHTRIDFQLDDGRIAHSSTSGGVIGLPGDTAITSHGSIGLDESLDLVLTVPAELLAPTQPPSNAVQAETIELKVTGTFAAPVIQRR
jgi:hypothetical protein